MHMGGCEESDGRHRPRILVGMGSRCRGGPGPKIRRGRHVAVHETVTTNPRKAERTLSKLVSQGRHTANTASLYTWCRRRHARPDRTTRDLGRN